MVRVVVGIGMVVLAAGCARTNGEAALESDGADESSTDGNATTTGAIDTGSVSNASSVESGGASAPSPPETHHYVLTRFDEDVESWSVTGSEEFIASVAGAHPDGGSVLVVRHIGGAVPQKLTRFAADGQVLQELALAPDVWVRDLVVDAQGRAYIAGKIGDSIGYAAYGPDFSEHWPTRKTVTDNGNPQLAIAPDGSVVYVAATPTSSSISKLDSEGEPLWSTAWPGPAAPEALGYLADVIVSPEGTIVLAIDTGDAESGDLWLDAFDSDGTELWAVSHADTTATGVAVTGSGTIVTVGMEILFGDGATSQPWVGGYSGTGALQWEFRTDVDDGLGPVHICDDGFVLTLNGARIYSDGGEELAVLTHDEPGGRYDSVAAFCPPNGGVVLLGNATFVE